MPPRTCRRVSSINTTTGLITGTISFAAAAGSPYSVSVTVRDGVDVDATDLSTWTVTDVNGNPTFDQNLGNRTDPENGPPISLDAGGTDPDGDPLTYAATNLPPGLSINTSDRPDHRHASHSRPPPAARTT